MPSSSEPKEAVISKSIVAYLNKLPRCRAHKVHGGPYGTAGEPDIDACINGRAVKIEVKRPSTVHTLTANQERSLARWRDAGALAFVAVSVDEVRERLEAEGLV